MLIQLRFAVYTALVCVLPFFTAAAQVPKAIVKAPNELSVADQAFLAARDAARVGDREKLAVLSRSLASHPLKAYVEYWQLVPRLRTSDPSVAADVAAFIGRHPNTYIADRLRLDWVLALGEKGDFSTFDSESKLLVWNTDDSQYRCFAALSQYRATSGTQADVLARDARQMLANTKDSAGVGCMALTDALLADGRIAIWDRVRALVEQNQFETAKRIGLRALDSNGKPVDSKLLAQAIDRPTAFLMAHEKRLTQVQRELATVAIVRLARDNPQQAADLADSINLLLTPEQRGIVWGRIGHMAALRLMPEANEWYRRGGENVGIGPDAARIDEVLEWQVRAALRPSDWRAIKSTIERMPAGLRSDPAWVYWYARALNAEGRPAEAQDHYAKIAPQFHFYGKLAAEELGQPIVIPPRAAPPTAEELAPMASNEGFARAFKFYELGLRVEGHREWNWQLRGMSDRQLLAAAEFANSRGLIDRMINTSDRTREEFNFEQRFPAPFRDTMVQYAGRVGVDDSWVYGLIRQESRFIIDARSSVGASGLMQLMPATARYVARKMNVADFAPGRVNDLEINLQLGTGYLKMVLDDLDGLPILATAAYNAGPGRARSWRASLPKTVEGAVFAETIPFNETRDYVKKVMSNGVYYAAMFEEKSQSLKQRLGKVSPKAAGATELP
ncbi:MAG: transglycosylase SLT domain-containing protein [Burkholderiaceae bacterium]